MKWCVFSNSKPIQKLFSYAGRYWEGKQKIFGSHHEKWVTTARLPPHGSYTRMLQYVYIHICAFLLFVCFRIRNDDDGEMMHRENFYY
jgi:hypothetical protein